MLVFASLDVTFLRTITSVFLIQEDKNMYCHTSLSSLTYNVKCISVVDVKSWWEVTNLYLIVVFDKK